MKAVVAVTSGDSGCFSFLMAWEGKGPQASLGDIPVLTTAAEANEWLFLHGWAI